MVEVQYRTGATTPRSGTDARTRSTTNRRRQGRRAVHVALLWSRVTTRSGLADLVELVDAVRADDQDRRAAAAGADVAGRGVQRDGVVRRPAGWTTARWALDSPPRRAAGRRRWPKPASPAGPTSSRLPNDAALFEGLAGLVAAPHTPGVRFGSDRTVAFDGCASNEAPDTDRNRSWLDKLRASLGTAGYPVMRLMTVVETGTRRCWARYSGHRPPAKSITRERCCRSSAPTCWCCATERSDDEAPLTVPGRRRRPQSLRPSCSRTASGPY